MLNFFSECFPSQSLLFCNLWGLSGLGEGGAKQIVTLCPCLVRAVWCLGGAGTVGLFANFAPTGGGAMLKKNRRKQASDAKRHAFCPPVS